MPVCLGMYWVGISYVLNYNTCKYRLNTYHNICQIWRKHIGMYCNTYQYTGIPASIGMCCLGIWYVWNNDTCKNRPNTYLFFQFVPMLKPIYSPILSQYNPIQTNTSPNTEQYKHKYTQYCFQYLHQCMPIQVLVLSDEYTQNCFQYLHQYMPIQA